MAAAAILLPTFVVDLAVRSPAIAAVTSPCDVPSYKFSALNNSNFGEGYQMALTPDGTKLVLAGDGNVHVVNPSTGALIRSIPLAGAWTVAVTSDSRAYASAYGGSTVTELNLDTGGTITPTITVPDARGLTFNASASRLFVAGYDSSIRVVDIAAGSGTRNTVIATYSLSGRPIGVATMDGFLYSPHWITSPTTMSVINASGTISTVSGLPGDGWAIAVDSASKRGYVTNNAANKVTPLNLSAPATPVVGTPFTATSAWGVAIEPGGARAIVTANQANRVDIINAQDQCVGAQATLTKPSAVTFSSDGTRAYVQAEYSAGVQAGLWQFERSVQPIFDTPVVAAGGFTVNVTNYDPAWTWTPSVTSGSVTAGTPSGSTLPLTISGVSSGASVRLTVQNARATYTTGSRALNLTATSLAPTFSTPVSTAGGFTVNVTNYDAAWTWTPSVASGSVTAGTPTGSTLPLSVTGLAGGASTSLSVTTSRSGFLSTSGSTTGQAQNSPAPSPSGSSGSSSSEPPSAVPTPIPTPTVSPLPGPETSPQGSAALFVDGRPSTVQVIPTSRFDGLDVSASGWTMTLNGLGPDGKPRALGANGTLVLDAQRDLRVTGTDFQAGSLVKLSVAPNRGLSQSGLTTRVRGPGPRSFVATRPTTIALGRILVKKDGSFAGVRELPPSLKAGTHVLLAEGVGPSGTRRELQLEVLVRSWIELAAGTRTRAGRLDRIRATGRAAGLVDGAKLTPYLSFGNRWNFTPISARVPVGADGSFAVSLEVRRKQVASMFVVQGDVTSNTRKWRRSSCRASLREAHASYRNVPPPCP